jgi:large subunit ribosomal protein L5
MAARLKEQYIKKVVPALTKEFGYKNVMAVPKIEKIALNIGLGEATQNAKLMDGAVNELSQIAGQKPIITKARKSIAAFKLRENMAIGCTVTLRGDRMYEFFDRLVNVSLPRVRDFRGVSSKSFDGRGNYTLGIKDQLIFPEIDYNKVDKLKGMNICITTTAKNRCRRSGAAETSRHALPRLAPLALLRAVRSADGLKVWFEKVSFDGIGKVTQETHGHHCQNRQG